MSLLEKTTISHQLALASYCRSGKYVTIPGVNERNVAHYRRLVYNVVEDTLQSAYPLSFALLTTKEWKNLVTRFFTEHACSSPQVWYMPKEFYEYVSSKPNTLTKKYPFLSELLWFEWLEVELHMMEDVSIACSPAGDLTKDKLVLNPEHHLQHFTFPVHLKNAKYITLSDKGNYFLVMHRHPESGNISFTDLSAAFIRMIELLGEKPMRMSEIVNAACSELEVKVNPQIINATVTFFERALENKLVLGYEA